MKLLSPLVLVPFAKAAIDGETPLTWTDVALPNDGTPVNAVAGVDIADSWPANPGGGIDNPATDGGVRVDIVYPAVGGASATYRDTYCVASWSFKDADGAAIASSFWSTQHSWSLGPTASMDMNAPVLNLQYPIGGSYEGDDRAGGVQTVGINDAFVINTPATAATMSGSFECFDTSGSTGAEFKPCAAVISSFPNNKDQLLNVGGQINVNGTWDSIVVTFSDPKPSDVRGHDDDFLTTTYDSVTGLLTIGSDVPGGPPFETVSFEVDCVDSCQMSCELDMAVIDGANTITAAVAADGSESFTQA